MAKAAATASERTVLEVVENVQAILWERIEEGVRKLVKTLVERSLEGEVTQAGRAERHEADDRWPSDFDDNQVVNVLDAGEVLPPYFGTTLPPTEARRDLVPDGAINILDVVRLTPPMFNQSCTP